MAERISGVGTVLSLVLMCADLSTVRLLVLDDLGLCKLPQTAAEDRMERIMRRQERPSTILTSNRPVDDWGKRLGPRQTPQSSTGCSTSRTPSMAGHSAGA